jgi:hypothetical protein
LPGGAHLLLDLFDDQADAVSLLSTVGFAHGSHGAFGGETAGRNLGTSDGLWASEDGMVGAARGGVVREDRNEANVRAEKVGLGRDVWHVDEVDGGGVVGLGEGAGGVEGTGSRFWGWSAVEC